MYSIAPILLAQDVALILRLGKGFGALCIVGAAQLRHSVFDALACNCPACSPILFLSNKSPCTSFRNYFTLRFYARHRIAVYRFKFSGCRVGAVLTCRNWSGGPQSDCAATERLRGTASQCCRSVMLHHATVFMFLASLALLSHTRAFDLAKDFSLHVSVMR